MLISPSEYVGGVSNICVCELHHAYHMCVHLRHSYPLDLGCIFFFVFLITFYYIADIVTFTLLIVVFVYHCSENKKGKQTCPRINCTSDILSFKNRQNLNCVADL